MGNRSINSMQWQKKFTWMQRWWSHCFATRKHHVKKQIMEIEKLWIPSIILPAKVKCVPADWRNAIQACFGAAEDFWIKAKFQNMLKNKDSLLYNTCTCSVALSVITFVLGFNNWYIQGVLPKFLKQIAKSKCISYKKQKDCLILGFSPLLQVVFEATVIRDDILKTWTKVLFVNWTCNQLNKKFTVQIYLIQFIQVVQRQSF